LTASCPAAIADPYQRCGRGSFLVEGNSMNRIRLRAILLMAICAELVLIVVLSQR
jgi:hypothetical protein